MRASYFCYSSKIEYERLFSSTLRFYVISFTHNYFFRHLQRCKEDPITRWLKFAFAHF